MKYLIIQDTKDQFLNRVSDETGKALLRDGFVRKDGRLTVPRNDIYLIGPH